jgi:hypothetical protein
MNARQLRAVLLITLCRIDDRARQDNLWLRCFDCIFEESPEVLDMIRGGKVVKGDRLAPVRHFSCTITEACAKRLFGTRFSQNRDTSCIE